MVEGALGRPLPTTLKYLTLLGILAQAEKFVNRILTKRLQQLIIPAENGIMKILDYAINIVREV